MDNRESERQSLDAAIEHIEKAARIVESLRYSRPKAKEAGALITPRSGAIDLIEEGLSLISLRPELLGTGLDPKEVSGVQARHRRTQRLAGVTANLSRQLEDTVRLEEALLYKAVMTAYAIGKLGSGSALIQQFVARMKKALALGPRSPRKSLSSASKVPSPR